MPFSHPKNAQGFPASNLEMLTMAGQNRALRGKACTQQMQAAANDQTKPFTPNGRPEATTQQGGTIAPPLQHT